MGDDRISPSVGDGLSATRDFIAAEIAMRFPGFDVSAGADSVYLGFPTGGGAVYTSDSFVVEPLVFPGGDLGSLTVAGTVNDLLCSGGWPEALFLNLLIGPRATHDAMTRILDSIAAEAGKLGIRLVGGDTKYLPDLPGLSVATSAFGIGRLRWGPLSLHSAVPGNALICTGSLGDHSIAVLSAREGLGFERVVTSDCAPLVSMVETLLENCGGVVALHDLTRGGLGGGLFDLAEQSGCTIELIESSLVVGRHVRAACEMLDVDPLFLANEGKMLVVVEAAQASLALDVLRSTDTGRDAHVVGHLVKASAEGKVLVNTVDDDLVVLTEPDGLPIPRLC